MGMVTPEIAPSYLKICLPFFFCFNRNGSFCLSSSHFVLGDLALVLLLCLEGQSKVN